MQWTERDGRLVHLPELLIVEGAFCMRVKRVETLLCLGDVVHLRAGREVPAKCVELTDRATPQRFKAGSFYFPRVERSSDDSVGVKKAQPLRCRVLETPYRQYVQQVHSLS